MAEGPAPATAPTTEPAAPPAQETKATPDAAPRKRHVGRTVAIGVVAVLALALVIGVFWGLSPTKAKPYDEGIDYGLRERNTLAYAALVNLGIQDPVVAMPLDGAVVTYDLLRSPAAPDAGLDVTPDDVQRGVIGAIAEVAPDVASLTVRQTEGGELNQTWVVQMADVKAFFAGELTFEQFEARITKS